MIGNMKRVTLIVCALLNVACVFLVFRQCRIAAFSNTACALLCLACALPIGKRRRELSNTAAEVLRSFPQVSSIGKLRVSRRPGRTVVDAVIELNAYSVTAAGELTVKKIEYALKQKLGENTAVTVKVSKPYRPRFNSRY